MSDNLVTIDCPYCGSPHLLPLEEDCDAIKMQAKAAMECTCNGSRNVRLDARIRAKIMEDTDEDEQCADNVIKIVNMMRDQAFDRVTIKVESHTYTLSRNADNVLKFKRANSKKEEMTL